MNETHLTDGAWQQRGLIRVWVPDAVSIDEWRALRAAREEEEIRAVPPELSPGRVSDIIVAAAAHVGTTPKAILARGRRDPAVRARQIAAWLLRRDGMTMTQVGHALGRDQSTINYAIGKVERTPELLEIAEATWREIDDEGAVA